MPQPFVGQDVIDAVLNVGFHRFYVHFVAFNLDEDVEQKQVADALDQRLFWTQYAAAAEGEGVGEFGGKAVDVTCLVTSVTAFSAEQASVDNALYKDLKQCEEEYTDCK